MDIGYNYIPKTEYDVLEYLLRENIKQVKFEEKCFYFPSRDGRL